MGGVEKTNGWMSTLRAYVRLMRLYLALGALIAAFSALWLADIAMPYSWIAARVTLFVNPLMWLGDKTLRAEQSDLRHRILGNYRFRWMHVAAVCAILLVAVYAVGAFSNH